jgi:Domain of unknown function (DUF6431)
MSVTWSCPIPVAAYAAYGRNAPAPRQPCGQCGREMAFDGSYPREVREGGVRYRIFVRRAFCCRCRVGDALFPDFVLRGRLDSAPAVGAAVLSHAGVDRPEGAEGLYAGAPARTVRSWRSRFSDRSLELWGRLAALSVQWGAEVPLSPPGQETSVGHALAAIGAVWRAASEQRPPGAIPPAWRLANVIVGGQLIGTRVDLPWPIVCSAIGRSRGP